MNSELSSRSNDISRETWDAFVAQEPSGHLLQSWEWGDFKAQFGWRPLRVALEGEGRIVAAAQVLVRRLPPGSIAYIPKGPVLDATDHRVSARLMAAIHSALRRYHPIWLKAEPDWPDAPEAREWLEGQRFRPSSQTIQPRHTLLIDLSQDEEAILGGMKPKTRYNVRLARKKGVTIREGGDDDLGAFYRLMQLTGSRDGFAIHSREYYAEAWRRFGRLDQARLLLAEYEGRVLAALMPFAFGGKAWYMYGASSDEQRQLMPNHLLQWEAIRWARSKGCHTYDLWGIPDLDAATLEAAVQDENPPITPSSPLWGVYRFKRGFGGQYMRYVGTYDYPYRPLLYRLLSWAWRRRMSG